MNDVTMPDTSVFAALNREYSAPIIARDLEDLLAGGGQLVVPASVYQEIKNTPDVDLRAAQLRQITDFRMEVQLPVTIKDRTDLFAEFAQIGQAARPARPPAAFNVEPKDFPIIADVRIYMKNAPARKVRFFTVERMINSKIAIERDYKIEFSLKSRKLANMGRRVPYSPRVAAPGAQPKFSWKFAIAGGAAVLVAQAGAILLMSVGANARSRERLTAGLTSLRPEIDRYLAARTRMVLDELAPGGQAHVVAEIELEYSAGALQTPTPGQFIPGVPELVHVRLDSIGIFPKKFEGESKPLRQHTQFGGFQDTWRYYYLSSELQLPQKEKVTQYRGVVETIKRLRTTLKAPTLSDAQRIDLRQDIIALEKWMDESFGVIDNFRPDPTLWTDDGRDRFR